VFLVQTDQQQSGVPIWVAPEQSTQLTAHSSLALVVRQHRPKEHLAQPRSPTRIFSTMLQPHICLVPRTGMYAKVYWVALGIAAGARNMPVQPHLRPELHNSENPELRFVLPSARYRYVAGRVSRRNLDVRRYLRNYCYCCCSLSIKVKDGLLSGAEPEPNVR
jgi:hypothetical protein